MSAPAPFVRAAEDACPGVSRPFGAADGSIVRVRTGGLAVPVDALAQLLELVAGQSDPSLQLTSRGALQLRGLPDPVPTEVEEAIHASGLVPSETHELARNIVTSPLSGLDGLGACDVRPIVAELDAALCARPRLALLPGRFLFAIDDGRGDVLRLPFDLGVWMTGAGPSGGAVVFAGGTQRGWRVDRGEVVPLLLALASEFVSVRERLVSSAWHVRELDVPLGPPAADAQIPVPAAGPPALGVHGDHAVVGVPLGLLTREHVAALAAVADDVVVTPWRSLVIDGGAEALGGLELAGLVVSSDSPWARLHACTGSPGCAKSALDTRAFAHDLRGRMPLGSLPVHISGCERRCGTPSSAYVDLVAPQSVDAAVELIRITEAMEGS